MKLIDLLVKELPKRGGWPSNALSVAQDSEGYCWGYMCKHLTLQSHGWWRSKSGDAICTDRIMIDEMASDWDFSFVTRTQYESALAASEGWIDWHGGDCPVDSDAIVEVKYRKPNPYQYNNDRAGDFYWAHTGSCGDIIAYRLHDHGINHRANDDLLEQDLNECIGQGIDIPEWNGGGLPPVGCECEWQDKNTKQWQPVKVVYSSEWVTVVREINKEKGGDLVEIAIENYGDESRRKFRPLRTEAEKAREKAITELASVICGDVPDTGMATAAMYAARIYDAGYRKEKK